MYTAEIDEAVFLWPAVERISNAIIKMLQRLMYLDLTGPTRTISEEAINPIRTSEVSTRDNM